MTCSLATRYRRDRAPRYPLAASRISRRFFFPWTLRFTRGMSFAPVLRPAPAWSLAQEALDHLRLRADLGHPGDPALAAAALLDQEVVARGLAAHDLPVHGHAEPLGGASVRLHLRHLVGPSSPRRRAGLASPTGRPSPPQACVPVSPAGLSTATPGSSGREGSPSPSEGAASGASFSPLTAARFTGARTMTMLRPSSFG